MARVIPFWSEESLQRLAEFMKETGLSERQARRIRDADVAWGRNTVRIGCCDRRVSARAMQLLFDQLAERGTLW